MPAPLRLLLPLPQTLASAPLLHLSRLLFSSPAYVGRAATLRALAYRGHPGRPRRGSSTLRKEMDGGGEKGVTFNRKRAEGTDGGKRGSMELKTRRLNPVNTTCYVQVRPSLLNSLCQLGADSSQLISLSKALSKKMLHRTTTAR
jgi:ribonuclease Z